MKKSPLFISLLVIFTLITACSFAEVAVEEAVLTVGEQSYTQGDLEALGTTSADYTNKDGETTTYTGCPSQVC